MIICSHNIPRKDCKVCMSAYNREARRKHESNRVRHGV
jgi:hypothetical protein